MDIQSIRTKLEGGQYSFSSLSLEERTALQLFFQVVPGVGFTEEQRQLIRGIYIVLPLYARNQIAFFNEQFGTSVAVVQLVNGDWVVSADLLTDAYAQGQARYPLMLTLATCTMRLVNGNEFPVEEGPV